MKNIYFFRAFHSHIQAYIQSKSYFSKFCFDYSKFGFLFLLLSLFSACTPKKNNEISKIDFQVSYKDKFYFSEATSGSINEKWQIIAISTHNGKFTEKILHRTNPNQNLEVELELPKGRYLFLVFKRILKNFQISSGNFRQEVYQSFVGLSEKTLLKAMEEVAIQLEVSEIYEGRIAGRLLSPEGTFRSGPISIDYHFPVNGARVKVPMEEFFKNSMFNGWFEVNDLLWFSINGKDVGVTLAVNSPQGRIEFLHDVTPTKMLKSGEDLSNDSLGNDRFYAHLFPKTIYEHDSSNIFFNPSITLEGFFVEANFTPPTLYYSLDPGSHPHTAIKSVVLEDGFLAAGDSILISDDFSTLQAVNENTRYYKISATDFQFNSSYSSMGDYTIASKFFGAYQYPYYRDSVIVSGIHQGVFERNVITGKLASQTADYFELKSLPGVQWSTPSTWSVMRVDHEQVFEFVDNWHCRKPSNESTVSLFPDEPLHQVGGSYALHIRNTNFVDGVLQLQRNTEDEQKKIIFCPPLDLASYALFFTKPFVIP